MDKQKLEEARQLAMSMTSHPVAFGTIEHTEKAGELLGLLWQEVLRLQCDLKDAQAALSPATADGAEAVQLSWVPLNRRDMDWHAHATVQLRAMHVALHAAQKTPRDPLEIEGDQFLKKQQRHGHADEQAADHHQPDRPGDQPDPGIDHPDFGHHLVMIGALGGHVPFLQVARAIDHPAEAA